MTIGLDVVIVTCVLANAAGLVAAAMTVYWRRTVPAGPRLLSFVVGVLLGAVLLDLLPHLWEATGNLTALLAMFAAALLVSWLFDSVCVCRHPPIRRCTSQTIHRHGGQRASPTRGAELLLAGDFVHSLVDGALIVAALAVGVVPGAVATLAVALHEVPRRIATVTLLVRGAVGLRLRWGWRCAPAWAPCWGARWPGGRPRRFALPYRLLWLCRQRRCSTWRWRSRSACLGYGVHVYSRLSAACPVRAGVLIIGGSHHLLALFG